MHTIINTLNPNARRTSPAPAQMPVRTPHYDCIEESDALKVVVYVPGVDASGVEITRRGPDLTVTARKSHFVRVNWQALHLEKAQRDYQLRLRLGNGLDYDALSAELIDGRLTLSLPKKVATAEHTRRVA
ncbi:MAG: Hsp20/alpha crystallin family protein [Nibricoccus sp.]